MNHTAAWPFWKRNSFSPAIHYLPSKQTGKSIISSLMPSHVLVWFYDGFTLGPRQVWQDVEPTANDDIINNGACMHEISAADWIFFLILWGGGVGRLRGALYVLVLASCHKFTCKNCYKSYCCKYCSILSFVSSISCLSVPRSSWLVSSSSVTGRFPESLPYPHILIPHPSLSTENPKVIERFGAGSEGQGLIQ